MKHLAGGTPFALAGWLALAIVLAATLAAWTLSRQNETTNLVIEPLPPEILEVTAPDWTENTATETSLADEEPERTLHENGEASPVVEPQIP